MNLIRANCARGTSIEIPLENAADRVLAQDIQAPLHFPPFAQSAMDGYAIATPDFKHYHVVGTCKAGDSSPQKIQADQALRIFTGAMTPTGCYAVIPQELVTITETGIDLQRVHIVQGMHIRPMGEQIQKGEIALKAGTQLNAGNIGFLAMLGIRSVQVYQRPRVGLITTGNELCRRDQVPGPGKIYESNSLMLAAALGKEGIACTSAYAEDDLAQLKIVIRENLDANDIVVLTGGISAGDYDLVREALSELDVETLVYKVAQKPGKPLFVGKSGSKLVFGLPGNPGAALTCFYVYVLPALRFMQGKVSGELLATKATLRADFEKPGSLSYFLKGKLEGGEVRILPAQSSAMLRDFGGADCLVLLEGEHKIWRQGESVDILLLPT